MTKFSKVTAVGAALLGLTVGGCQAADVGGSEVSPRSITNYVTSNSAEGEIEYRIGSMFDGSETTMTAHLRYPRPGMYRKGEVEVVLPDGFEPERGTYLIATGDFDGNGRLIADDIEVVAPPAIPVIDPEWHPLRRIGTILLFWEGESGGMANPAARASMFLDDESTHAYYGENSYGKENVIGEVFGPYKIEDPGGCNTGLMADRAVAAMIEKGHDPDNYIQLMYHFPGGAGCGWGGLATLGSPLQPAQDSWYNGSFGCVVRNQEIGHNYGMRHSRSYQCNIDGETVPFSDTCSDTEYGHPYDPMGGGCGHMNNVQKRFMGWLEDCNVVTAPADGTFNLMATELPCNGTQSLRIPTNDGRYYYLEYRQVLGKFDAINGVLVHVAPGDFGNGPTSYILDFGEDWYLNAGQSYTDPEGTVTFEILEENDIHAVVRVTYPDGGGGEPTCDNGEAPLSEGGNIGSMECAADVMTGDIVPPEVQLVYPEHGDYFLPGSDFNIVAEVSDDRVVADVELYVNGESFFRLLEEPWEYPVNGIPEGDYELGIVARDGVNWTPSNAVTIHVTNDIPEDDDDGGVDESGGEGDGDDGADEADDDGLGDGTADESGDGTGGDPGASDPEADGCSCSSDAQHGAPAGVLLGLILLGLRRRD